MLQSNTSSSWTPFEEPLRTTVLRTGTIALVIGTIMVVASAHRISWPVAVVVALWPAFGGHWIELWFLNWLRPRIARERRLQVLARLAVWLVGGIALALMMGVTARALGEAGIAWRGVWLGGLVFLAFELVIHAALAGRGQGSFYDGRG
jgi:hypothetical protein